MLSKKGRWLKQRKTIVTMSLPEKISIPAVNNSSETREHSIVAFSVQFSSPVTQSIESPAMNFAPFPEETQQTKKQNFFLSLFF